MKTPGKLMIIACMLAGTAMWAGNPNEPVTTERAANILNSASPEKSRNILKVRQSVFGKALREDERESHGPGTFVNLGIFLPSESYMDPYYDPEFGLFNVGYSLEVGNYFRFFNTDRFGVGLRVSWIQLGYVTHSDTAFVDGNWYGSPLRLGVQGSYAINDVMGLDVFYQLGPHYSMTWFDGENSSYVGVNHELGFAYRFTLFTAGVGYKFGMLKNIDHSEPNWPLDDEKYSSNMIRVFLGVQL